MRNPSLSARHMMGIATLNPSYGIPAASYVRYARVFPPRTWPVA